MTLVAMIGLRSDVKPQTQGILHFLDVSEAIFFKKYRKKDVVNSKVTLQIIVT